MILPTAQECYELLDKYRVLANVRKHIEQVTKVAVFIAKRLRDKKIPVNVELVERAALLHDLLKPIDFEDFLTETYGVTISLEDAYFFSSLQDKFSGLKHEEAAFELLKPIYPEVANVIRKHAYSAIVDGKLLPFTWEEKIVAYADKRVVHDKIVTLKERFEDGHARYFSKSNSFNLSESYLDKNDSAFFDLEKELFGIIGISPDAIEKEA